MVNNSTNINKKINHISPQESLNSDGQQFHQYQQNEQSHHLSLQMAGDRHENVAGLHWLMRFQTSHRKCNKVEQIVLTDGNLFFTNIKILDTPVVKLKQIMTYLDFFLN